jgi:hypothetical protein
MRHSLPSPPRRDERSCGFTWIRRRTAPSLDVSNHFRHPNLHHTTPKAPVTHARTNSSTTHFTCFYIRTIRSLPTSDPTQHQFRRQNGTLFIPRPYPQHRDSSHLIAVSSVSCIGDTFLRTADTGSRTTTAVSTLFFVELDAQGRETRAMAPDPRPFPPSGRVPARLLIRRGVSFSRPCFLPRIRSSTVHVRLL